MNALLCSLGQNKLLYAHFWQKNDTYFTFLAARLSIVAELHSYYWFGSGPVLLEELNHKSHFFDSDSNLFFCFLSDVFVHLNKYPAEFIKSLGGGKFGSAFSLSLFSPSLHLKHAHTRTPTHIQSNAYTDRHTHTHTNCLAPLLLYF